MRLTTPMLCVLGLLAVGCKGDTTDETPTPSGTVTPTPDPEVTNPAVATDPPAATPTAEPEESTELPTAESTQEPTAGSTPTATTAPTPEPTATATPGPLVCGEGTRELDGACVPDLPGEWTQIFPGGDTICSRGTPFSYWVRPGTVNKLVVGFDGGGACWDAITCSEANPTFSEEVNDGDNPANLAHGAMDLTDARNPMRDWFVVFIPYCTGDIHWGDSVTTYKAKAGYPDVTVNHKGFVNGQSVMNWIYDHFSKPEDMFVTGISAGAYGSLMFAPYLMEHYPHTQIYQNGDSGAGVVTREFMLSEEEGFNAWKAWDNFPPWLLEEATKPQNQLTFSDAYILAANHFPDQFFSQYNTAFDDVQIVFYVTMGGRPGDWSGLMEDMVGQIVDSTDNFQAWTNWGSQHGVLAYDEFYTYQVEGNRLRDWFADMVAGEGVDTVHCVDCETEEYYSEPSPVP